MKSSSSITLTIFASISLLSVAGCNEKNTRNKCPPGIDDCEFVGGNTWGGGHGSSFIPVPGSSSSSSSGSAAPIEKGGLGSSIGKSSSTSRGGFGSSGRSIGGST